MPQGKGIKFRGKTSKSGMKLRLALGGKKAESSKDTKPKLTATGRKLMRAL